MLVDKKSYYFLKIILFFSFVRKKSFSISELSKRLNISEKVLEQVMLILKKKGFLTSKRGPQGGYTASGDFTSMSVFQLFERMGSQLYILSVQDDKDDVIADVLNDLAVNIEIKIKGEMKSVLIKDLVKDIKERVTKNELDFII